MTDKSIYEQFRLMGSNVVLSYKGEINNELLETIYSSMDRHFSDDTSEKQRKRFFHVLVEALQNVFHHQSRVNISSLVKPDESGFIILDNGNAFQLITGNYVYNIAVPDLKNKIDEVNVMQPEELRKHYQQVLSETELSEKGGAGLGIIEMVRRSGNPLKYEFKQVNDSISFFCLSILMPKN
jgi:hypothetical protein